MKEAAAAALRAAGLPVHEEEEASLLTQGLGLEFDGGIWLYEHLRRAGGM